MKNKIYLFLLPAVIGSLMVVVFFMRLNEQKNTNSDSNVSNSQVIQNQPTNDENTVSEAAQTLAVDPQKCRGCGRCATFDPEHFTMSKGLAVVKTQANLNSNTLETAIRFCPENAITLS